MFSVLISIYYKELPEHFNACMTSIWDDQTLKPSEIIMIEDGPLTSDLNMMISHWQAKLGDILKITSVHDKNR